MKKSCQILTIVMAIFIISIPNAYAMPTIQIVMDQTTFSYGEKLFYVFEVNEITGDFAIIHIRDEFGKGSSAIPIEISELKTQITSPYPFEKEVFPVGKYYIDVEYSGAKDTVEFDLIDLGKIVIPFWVKQIAYSWITGEISGGVLIDAIQKTVEKDVIDIPGNIDKNNINEIHIPDWVKIIAVWWLEEKISDEDFARALQHLIKVDTITI